MTTPEGWIFLLVTVFLWLVIILYLVFNTYHKKKYGFLKNEIDDAKKKNLRNFILILLLNIIIVGILIYLRSPSFYIFIVLALYGLIILAGLKEIKYSIFAFLLCIPAFHFIKYQFLLRENNAVFISSIPVWIIFLIFFVRVYYHRSFTEEIKNRRGLFLILLFAFVSMFSILSASFIPEIPRNFINPFLSTNIVNAEVGYEVGIIEPIMLFLLILLSLKKESEVKEYLMVICIFMALTLLGGIIQTVQVGGFNVRLVANYRGFKNVNFYYFHMNLFVLVPLLVFPLGIACINLVKGYYKKILLFTLLLGIIISIFFTLTRGAWFAFLLECLLLFILYKQSRKYLISLSMGIIFTFLILMPKVINILFIRFPAKGLVSNTIQSRFGEAVSGSLESRLKFWAASFKIMKSYPFGLGAYNFDTGWYKFGDLSYCIIVNSAHNLFLCISTEFGILSLLIFLVLIIYYLRINWKLDKLDENKDIKAIKYSIFISIIVFIFYAGTAGGALGSVATEIGPINTSTLIIFVLLAIISFLHQNKLKNKKEIKI